MEKVLFAFRGWFIFACFTVVVVLKTISENPFIYSGLWLVLAGCLVRLVAGLYIGGHTGGTVLSGGELAKSGAYGLSRNPLYLGNLLACGGVLILANCLAWWLNMLLITSVFMYYRALVLAEERYLLGKFGKEYAAHLNRVPRWINFRAISGRHNWKPIYPLAGVLKAQLPSIGNAVVAVFILFIL